MSLLDRHIAFIEALRGAGLPVSLAEDLDAVRAVGAVELIDREAVRAGYAATLVKRQVHRKNFDEVFDVFFPPLIGGGVPKPATEGGQVLDDGSSLRDLRSELGERLGDGDRQGLEAVARDAVGRFGALRGRAPGLSSWSAYSTLSRVEPDTLVDQVVAGLVSDGEPEPVARRTVTNRVADFNRRVEADARRRVAEEKGPEHVARTAVRPSIENLDFMNARKADLDELRREIYPLARRLATRLSREHHARRRGPVHFRRTVRASISSGGVPLVTHHKPKRPGRTDLVVLCDVSGSVANFAQFTLMLVYALREQFTRVRAFTFVDDIHEVTHHFRPGADPVDTMLALAESARHATLWGRTNYGRAFESFAREFPDALTPRTSLLVLGDARSNYSDLGLSTVKQMSYDAKHAWWLNPEHRRHWNTGDSAAATYAELIPMVECRNLTQLGGFIHDIA